MVCLERMGWRNATEAEKKAICKYMDVGDMIAGLFFRIWVLAGILCLIFSSASILIELTGHVKEGSISNAVFIFIGGLLGLVIIYLFFVRFGGYLKRRIDKQRSDMWNNPVMLCEAEIKNKSRVMGTGRHKRWLHFADVMLPGGDMKSVRISQIVYRNIHIGDRLVIIKCEGQPERGLSHDEYDQLIENYTDNK